MDILAAKGVDRYVVGEVRARTLPRDWPWAILVGVEECAHLLAGLDCTVSCLDEGTLFRAGDPAMVIEGNYTAFGQHETVFLGFLCQASGIATGVARCRIAAGDRVLLSFGARRMHPVVAPMIERSAYVGGCDGVSAMAGADLIGVEPTGTMPHALVLVMGDTLAATQAFHEVVAPHVRRISLTDTFHDEKFETLRVAEAMGEALYAVRLDTPASRRGDFLEILCEVRWELDLRGFNDVRLIVSGGIDEGQILHLNPVVDGYGVGTSISNAPTVDLAFDIVEIEGKPMAKRGKRSGAKQLWRCPACGESRVTPRQVEGVACTCGQAMAPLLQPLLDRGEIVRELPSAQAIRQHVLAQLAALERGVEI
jgi:nicotinate phosphoribosyltransferase